jgi:hypothetical protein
MQSERQTTNVLLKGARRPELASSDGGTHVFDPGHEPGSFAGRTGQRSHKGEGRDRRKCGGIELTQEAPGISYARRRMSRGACRKPVLGIIGGTPLPAFPPCGSWTDESGGHMRFAGSKLLLCAVSLTILCGGSSRTAPAQQNAKGDLFEFHSGFWINLHHFLYRQAQSLEPQKGTHTFALTKADSDELQQLSAAERDTWNEAVSYCSNSIVKRDLLFDDDLIQTKNQLENRENSSDLEGVKIPAEPLLDRTGLEAAYKGFGHSPASPDKTGERFSIHSPIALTPTASAGKHPGGCSCFLTAVLTEGCTRKRYARGRGTSGLL